MEAFVAMAGLAILLCWIVDVVVVSTLGPLSLNQLWHQEAHFFALSYPRSQVSAFIGKESHTTSRVQGSLPGVLGLISYLFELS